MLIDWFTVGAQVLNFLVLVGLLKHVLYRPILNAIAERERKIADELATAAHQKQAAITERELYQLKNQQFANEQEQRLNTAIEQAHAERQRLFTEARASAESFKAQCFASIENETRHLNEAINRQIQQEVFSIARQVLSDLADANLEAQIVGHFVRRLNTLDTVTKNNLSSAMHTYPDAVVVRSSFVLTPQLCTMIQQAITSSLSVSPSIQFKTLPTGICGIELSANAWKVAWHIGDYLGTLEKNVALLLAEQSHPQSQSADLSEAKL